MLKLAAIGNLGADPELDYTGSGTARSRFRVGCPNGRRDEAGKPETTWINCTAFGKIAENVAEYLRRGSKVYLEGRPEARPFTDKSGEARASLDVTVGFVEFLSPRSESSENVGREDRSVRGPAPQPGSYQDLDDLPF